MHAPAPAEPGSRITITFQLKNQTTRPIAWSATTADVPVRPDGELALSFSEPGSEPRGAGAWLSATPTAGTLPAATEQSVSVLARIPETARPGGWYGAVHVRARPLGAGDVEVVSEVPVVFLFVVRGEFQRSLDAEIRPLRRWRWRGGHATWRVRLHNTGDVHENVSGAARLDPLISHRTSIPLDSAILLPGERRSISLRHPLREAPDVIAADVRVERSDGPDVVARADRMFVLPWWSLLLVLASCAVIWWRASSRRDRRPHGGDEHDAA